MSLIIIKDAGRRNLHFKPSKEDNYISVKEKRKTDQDKIFKPREQDALDVC